MTKLCIFDLDGTLAETQESIARPVNMTLEYYGLPKQPVEAFNYFAGDGIKNALKRALIASGDTEASHLEEGLPMCRRWMQEDPCYKVRPYDHMIWALDQLKAHGIRIAVFSNKPHLSAVSVVEAVFGKGYFDHIQGQTDRILIKPDPEGVKEILNKYNISRDECLYFGDTNTDMLTAHNAEVTAVGVSWGFRPRSELEQYRADIIIDSPAEIPGLAGITVPIRLAEITEENWLEVMALSVREDQKGFVAPAVGILARGYVYRNCNARVFVIESDGVAVGVALVREFSDEPLGYDLQQFMIDQRYQGRGYGSEALGLLLDELRSENHFDHVEVCVKKDDAEAIRLYTKHDFIDSGYIDEDAPDSLNMICYLSRR